MVNLVYEYEIPDTNRPIPESARGLGASGVLVPFKPAQLQPEQVIGRTIDQLEPYLGTYGMGGPGFFGLRLGAEWLVVAIWGAAEWVHANDLLVADGFHDDYGRPTPWLSEDSDRLSECMVGERIISIEIERHRFKLVLSNDLELKIEEYAARRPILEGTKEPRAFSSDDDLRRVIFLSPTAEIWV